MTVKMCIKPFPSPINKFSDTIGVSRSLNRTLEDKHLRLIKSNIRKKKDMPKKPRTVILGSNNPSSNVSNSTIKLYGNRYGLRAANERISSRKDKEFIYDDNKVSTAAPNVQVKNAGDSFTFIIKDNNQEEEHEGGIVEPNPKQSLVVSNEVDKQLVVPLKESADEKKKITNNFHLDGRSEKASAGTVAFVQILLHTLSCSLSCQQPSCRKMGMVLKHYKSCQEKRKMEAISRASMTNSEEKKHDDQGKNISPKCGLCQQFAKIVAQHSMYLCNMSSNETGCPVPMCDMMRKIRNSQKSSPDPEPMQM